MQTAVFLVAAAARLAAEEPSLGLFPRGYPPALLLDGSEPTGASFSSLALPDRLPSLDAPAPEPGPGFPPRRRVFDAKTVLAAGGLFSSVAAASYVKWWSGNAVPFHFRSEGFAGRDTYAGGLDKASHFFFSAMFFEPVDRFYGVLEHPPSESDALALGTVFAMGAIVEASDGFGTGASWEDLAADGAGVLTAFILHKTNLGDTVGFRLGLVPTRGTPGVYKPGPFDVDYSQEIYSADVKLVGLFRRLRVSPGPARFLLLSMTYDTKGYGQATVPADARERNIGLALGLNLAEIARALGVPENFWWSRPLYGFLTYFRVPYTAFGFRYDLNHRRWQGPDTGDRYKPRSAP